MTKEKNKIIQILNHIPPLGDINETNPRYAVTNNAVKVTSSVNDGTKLFFFNNDWHVILSKFVLKNTNRFQFECWRPYPLIKGIETTKLDNIVHRLFPDDNIQGIIDFIYNNVSEKDVICLHGLYSNFIRKLLFKLDLNKFNVIVHHHGGESYLSKKFPVNPVKMILSFKEINKLRNTKFVTLTSQDEFQFLESKGLKNLQIMNMGYNENIFYPRSKALVREELKIPPSSKVVLFVGRFVKEKGFFKLLSSAQRLIKIDSNLQFIFIGGKFDASLQAHENFTFLNTIGGSLLSKYYNASDLFVLPSKSEGLPISLLEAMSCNLQTLATNVGGLQQISEEFGYPIFLAQDASDLDEKILEMINLNVDLELNKKIETRFSSNIVSQNLIRMYSDSLGGI